MTDQTTKPATIDELLEAIYYNLSHYQYLYEKSYMPISKIKSIQEYIDTYAKLILSEAEYCRDKLALFYRRLNKETDKQKRDQLLMMIDMVKSSVHYNIQQVAGNKYQAKQMAKKTLHAYKFKIKLAPQTVYARPYDSVAQINLFGSNNIITKEIQTGLEKNFRLIKSFGPLFNNSVIGSKTSQESVSLVLSKRKPDRQTNHRIWINDQMMIEANFKTNTCLNDYLNNNPDDFNELMFMVMNAQDIWAKMNGNLSQAFVDAESERTTLEYTKRQNEHQMEQYLLLSVELFDQLVVQLKELSRMENDSNIFKNINYIPRIRQRFSKEDIADMRAYRTLRNNIAHPIEYNLRPSLLADMFDNFVPNMRRFLSKLINIDENTIQRNINAIEPERFYDMRSLILLIDSKKALESLCRREEKMAPNESDVFLKLGIISKENNDILKEAQELRKTICHHKITPQLARKASELKNPLSDIIVEVADAVESKYQLTIQDYYHPDIPFQPRTTQDIMRTFPALFSLLDEDTDVLKTAISERTNNSNPDKEILAKLYSFAITVNAVMFERENFKNNPYYEREDLRNVMNSVTQNSRHMDKNDSNKRKIFKIVGAHFVKDGILAQQKSAKNKEK